VNLKKVRGDDNVQIDLTKGPLPVPIFPGGEVLFRVPFTTPDHAGSYSALFRLVDSSGTEFGPELPLSFSVVAEQQDTKDEDFEVVEHVPQQNVPEEQVQAAPAFEFQQQFEEIKSMGFQNEDLIKMLLVQTHGDTAKVCNVLIQLVS